MTTNENNRIQRGTYSAYDAVDFEKYMVDRDLAPFGDLSWQKFGIRVQNPVLEGLADSSLKEIAKFVEDSISFAYFFTRSTTSTDVVAAIATYARALTGESLVYSALTSDMFAMFKHLFMEDVHVQGSWVDGVSSMREVLTKFDQVRGSQLFKKLHSLMLYLLTFSVCDKMGVTFDRLKYSKLESESLKRDHSSSVSFIHCILDTITFILERGVTFMRTGTWTSFLHSGDKYEAWYDKSCRVREYSKLLSDPEIHGFDEPLFQKELAEVLEVGNAIYEEAKTLGNSERRYVAKVMSDMRMIKAEYLGMSRAREKRDVPFSMVCVGPSEIGKSNVVKFLISMYAKWHNLPVGDDYEHVFEADQEFWSGFTPAKWALILDDIGALAPKLAENGLDKLLMQIVSIVNSIPLVTNQAAVEDKGRIPFRGKFVIGTANTKHMNAQFVYSYPLAMLRRLAIVLEMKVKPEFSKNGTLDRTKAMAANLQMPDYYDIKVMKVGPAFNNGVLDPTRCAYEVVNHNGVRLEDVGMAHVLAYLFDASQQHNEVQHHMRDRRRAYEQLEVCEVCHLPKPCACVVQSDESDLRTPESLPQLEPLDGTETPQSEPEDPQVAGDTLREVAAVLETERFTTELIRERGRAAPNWLPPPVQATGVDRSQVLTERSEQALRDAQARLAAYREQARLDYLNVARAETARPIREDEFHPEPDGEDGTPWLHGRGVAEWLWNGGEHRFGWLLSFTSEARVVATTANDYFRHYVVPVSPYSTDASTIWHILGAITATAWILPWPFSCLSALHVVMEMVKQLSPYGRVYDILYEWCPPLLIFLNWHSCLMMQMNSVIFLGWRGTIDMLATHLLRPDAPQREILMVWLRSVGLYFCWRLPMIFVLFLGNMGSPIGIFLCKFLVSWVPGSFLMLIPPLWNIYSTGSRLRKLFRRAGMREGHAMAGTRAVAGMIAGVAALKLAMTIAGYLTEKVVDQTSVDTDATALNEKRDGIDTQSIDSEAKTPEPHPTDVDQANVWYKDDYVCTLMDSSPEAASWKGMGSSEIKRILNRSILYLRSTYDREGVHKVKEFRAVGLIDQIYVTNTHNLVHGENWKLHFTWTNQGEQVASNGVFDMDETLIKDLGDDVSLFRIPFRPPVRNILPLVASEGLRGQWNGYRLVRMPDGSIVESKRTGYNRETRDLGPIGKVDVWMSHGEPSLDGYCGSPYFAETPYGPLLVGLHILGSPHYRIAGALQLSREKLQQGIDDWAPLAVQGVGPSTEVKELHKKDPVRFVERGFLDVYGSIGTRTTQKSKVQRTLISPFFIGKGWEVKHGAPLLHGWRPNRRALLTMVEPKTRINHEILDAAVRDYEMKLAEIPLDDYSVVHVVDEATAILGAPGIPHLERLAMSTSAGYPFRCTKRSVIDVMSGQVVNDEVRAEIDRIKACYDRGERAFPIFNACYKDEPTSFAKVAIHKTRVFLISNVAFTIVCRQLLMGHIRFFTSHRFECEMGVGLNCHSAEWSQLFEYMTFFGEDKCDNGDFKSFDSSQMSELIIKAFEVFDFMAERAGWSHDQRIALRCLAYDTAFAMVNWFGTLIQLQKGNPSGHVMTTFINCIVVILVMRYAFVKVTRDAGRALVRFSSHVHLMAYGDDSIQNFSSHIVDIYNHLTLERELAKIGFVYTMATKDAKAVPYISVHNISFLKRRWRWDEEVQEYLAPLEMESIKKSLLVALPSRSVSEEQRCVDSLSSALREAFHHGRPTFDNFRKLFLDCVDQINLHDWVKKSSFPTFIELQAQFYECSKHVYRKQGRDAPVHLNVPAAQIEPELLLDVQGCVHSQRVAVSLSHLGDPRSWFLPKSRLDSTTHPKTTDTVWVDLSEVFLRPAKFTYQRAIDALKSTERHLLAVNPVGYPQLLSLECDTPCLCEFCRPQAREIYGCYNEECPACDVAFSATKSCRYPFSVTVRQRRLNERRERQVYMAYFRARAAAQTKLEVQSSEGDVMSLEETAAGDEETHVVTHFVDHTAGVTVDYPRLWSDVRDGDHIADVELSTFLNRPVLLDTITWSETDSVPTTWGPYYPWKQYFSNSTIQYRLNNYSAVACTLRLKVVVNASPFYFGSMIWNYIPFGAPSTLVSTTNSAAIVTASQYPHIWVYPSNQQGGELTCPFFYERNWLNLTIADTQSMGTLYGRLVNQIASANGASGASVTMQIWAWAEDVKLLGPTTALAVQSGERDEYSKNGAISAPASAVARVANKLSKVPIIGPAATAVGSVARALGDTASLFGYSNPPVLASPSPMVPKPFANFASTDISTTVEKLTLDSKNDITVDPRVAGLPADDELALRGLFGRESYLCNFTFSTTNAVDDLLFAAMVQPNGLMAIDPTGNNSTYPVFYSTPLNFFTQMFTYWRGSIVFRFKIVATPYHQGRVRFSYDPVSNIVTSAPDYAAVFNEIVDLAECNDFEVVVPYMQAYGWLRTQNTSATTYASNTTPVFVHQPIIDNGMITIRPVTKLTAPVSSSTISVQVFVRAGDDFEVAAPQKPQDMTFLTIQSSETDAAMTYGATHQIVIGKSLPKTHDDLFLVNMGEKVASMRQLLNRTNFAYSTQCPNSTDAYQQRWFMQTPYPAFYGYSSTGRHSADTQSGTPATYGFNFANNTPWHMMSQCFAGMRGSMMWSWNLNTTSSTAVINDFSVYRRNFGFNNSYYSPSDQLAAITTSNVPRYMLPIFDYTQGGSALTNTRTNTGLQALVPFYSQKRFISTSTVYGETGPSDWTNNIMLAYTTYPSIQATQAIRLDSYFSAGPDFTFLFFLAAAPYSLLAYPNAA